MNSPRNVTSSQDKESSLGQLDQGTVYFVGTGPGDRRLITLWGRQCLAQADVVVYDDRVDRQVLEFSPYHCERVPVRHHSPGGYLSQEQVNRVLLEKVRAGKRVVRLTADDPVISGCYAEEALVLKNHGVRVVTIPGIPAGLAVGSLAEIPLTHSELAPEMAFIAGTRYGENEHGGLDYQSLAACPGTVVYCLERGSANELCRKLIAAGRSPDTPVAIVRGCGSPEQRTYRTTLQQLPEFVEANDINPPGIVIVGDVVSLAPESSWYTSQPLFGKRFLVTRPEHQTTELRELLEDLGGYVISQPTIEILPPESWEQLDRAIQHLPQYRWVVFTSVNGVSSFFDRLLSLGKDARHLANVKIAAIGPGTKAALQTRSVLADLIPREFYAEALAERLNQLPERGRILLVRANRGRPILQEMLRQGGWTVEQVVAYRSCDVASVNPELLEQMNQGQIDWVTVTSSSIARSLVKLFGETMRRTHLASISPITSAALRELGFSPTVEAEEYTLRGLVLAILQHVIKSSDNDQQVVQ